MLLKKRPTNHTRPPVAIPAFDTDPAKGVIMLVDILDEYQLLSPRELEVLQCLANGLSSKMIAEELEISFDTVESHRKNIFKKTGVHTSAEAVAYGFRNKLIQ